MDISSFKHKWLSVVSASIVIITFIIIVCIPSISIESESSSESAKITFQDVAGIDDAVDDLKDIAEFLKTPEKFTALGAHLPKGVLLYGPPGTGKTLLAKALAGETDCHFLSRTGSEFVDEYVGVGARQVRELFEEARNNAPCIIFIDEIDAIGKRGNSSVESGSHEYAHTINQFLSEMDGFAAQEGVIVIGATNYIGNLDDAFLRPGRFDRKIYIPLPDTEARCEILQLHAKKIKLHSDVDLMDVARKTFHCSGAHLENILNESAMIAAKNKHKTVRKEDVSLAVDKILFGQSGRAVIQDEEEKRATAYHEAGHAIVATIVSNTPVDSVSIQAHGFSLGRTITLPEREQLNYWRSFLIDDLATIMGGRAAEEIFLGDVSDGASNDIERASDLAHSMVREWGMTKVGLACYRDDPHSEKVSFEIADEVRRLVETGYEKASSILKNNKEKVHFLAHMLMQFETLDADDIAQIMDGSFDPDEKKLKIHLTQSDCIRIPLVNVL